MLKYVGNGAFIVEVPARDLTAKEVRKYGKRKLLSSGLYAEPKTIKNKPANEKQAKE
jgi:hypothetical protein